MLGLDYDTGTNRKTGRILIRGSKLHSPILKKERHHKSSKYTFSLFFLLKRTLALIRSLKFNPNPDPHNFCILDPHHIKDGSALDPHQMKIRIRIKVISWIRNRIRINSQMTNQNAWNVNLFEHFFKELSLYLEARIWIRICIWVKSRIRIQIK
jgi:hypothetical protein